jgi:polysaccharide deacetylase 2 family uncharacterized protein YibQ
MTKVKTKRKRGRHARRGSSLRQQAFKLSAGLVLLIALVLLALLLTQRLLQRQRPVAAVSPSARPPVGSEAPPFEIYRRAPIRPAASSSPAPRPTVAPRKEGLPRVALLIDDLGYQRRLAERFIDLEAVLSVSIFPYSPQRRHLCDYALRRGREVLLHLPMEPMEYPAVNPGPGALLSAMDPDQLIDQLRRNLDSVPVAVGVNNHMGSRITAESERMNQIFSELRKRGLFFIDSRTTPKTIAKSSARLLGVPFAERNVFLDHDLSPESIRAELHRLLTCARRDGVAIGIAHPHAETLAVLKRQLPLLKGKVRWVPVSAVTAVPG